MGITRTTNGTAPGKYEEIGEGIGAGAFYGYIEKTTLPVLRWPGAHTTYDKIWRENPETVVTRNMSASLVGNMPLTWELPLEANNKELPPPTKDDEAALDFCYSVGDAIEGDIRTWLADCVIKAPFYGFGLWEMVPGLRKKNWTPPDDDPWRSTEDDGLVGFRRLGFRDYSTFYRWDLTDKGYVKGVEQVGNTGKRTTIPAKQLLHIRYGDMANPEGIAILEAVYRPEYMKRQLEVVFGHGSEKSAGVLMVFADEKLSPADITHIRNTARAVLSAQEGNFAAWPKGLKGEIQDIPFAAGATITEMIRYYGLSILTIYGMEFIGMGGISGTGSYAALNDSSSTALLRFNSMVEGFVRQASEQITKYLFTLNASAFPNLTRYPMLKISPSAKNVALAELGQFAQIMHAIRPLGDDDLIAIRKRSGVLSEVLPEVEEPPIPEPEPEPDAAATDEVLPEDETITNEDEAGADLAQGDKVKPKGGAITVTGADVTKADIDNAVNKFAAWAKKNAPGLSDLLEAEVPESQGENDNG